MTRQIFPVSRFSELHTNVWRSDIYLTVGSKLAQGGGSVLRLSACLAHPTNIPLLIVDKCHCTYSSLLCTTLARDMHLNSGATPVSCTPVPSLSWKAVLSEDRMVAGS